MRDGLRAQSTKVSARYPSFECAYRHTYPFSTQWMLIFAPMFDMAGDPIFNRGIHVIPLVLPHREGKWLALDLENGKGGKETMLECSNGRSRLMSGFRR